MSVQSRHKAKDKKINFPSRMRVRKLELNRVRPRMHAILVILCFWIYYFASIESEPIKWPYLLCLHFYARTILSKLLCKCVI